MMNKPLLFLLVVFSFPAYGINANVVLPKDTNKPEELKYRSCVGGSFGFGVPMGFYGATNYNDCYAKNGIHFEVNYSYLISPQWGLQLDIQGNINKLDPDYGNELTIDYGGSQSFYNVVSGGNYYLGEYLLGPIYTYKEDDGDILEGRFLIGILSMNQEAIQATVTEQGPYTPTPVPVSFPSRSISVFGAELGLSYKYNVSKRFYITVNLACTIGYFNVLENNYSPSPALTGLMELVSGSGGLEFKL
jgi:hypothetical protein